MALLDFCISGRRDVNVLNFHHGTDFSEKAGDMVRDFCTAKGVSFNQVHIADKPSECKMSMEEYWSGVRRLRYEAVDGVVATGHNLDDAVEWWMMTCMRGSPRLMPVTNGTVTRPFLLTKKSELVEWCDRKSVPYIVDPTNLDGSNDRGKIREMMPLFEKVNPGIRTTIRNLYTSGL